MLKPYAELPYSPELIEWEAGDPDAPAQIEQDDSPCTTSLNDVFRNALERLRSMGITSSTLELVPQDDEN